MKIQWKNGIYKYYQNSSIRLADFEILQNAISEVSELIYEKKNDYYHQLPRKLIDSKASCKTYWSILKTFYNNKKMPLIPPLLIGNKSVSDFREKANHFNKYFASICTTIDKNSCLPISVDLIPKSFSLSFHFQFC